MSTPEYVPFDYRTQWSAIYTSALQNGNEYATIVANKWLLETAPVAKPRTDIMTLAFEFPQEQLLAQAEDGDLYMSAVLADNQPTLTGHTFPEEILQKFADDINQNTAIGDMDHEYFDRLIAKGLSDDQIVQALKSKPAIVRAVKAMVDKGKLWVRLFIDKRYKNLVQRAKGLSLEALSKTNPVTKRVNDAKFLGFTLNMNSTPANPRTTLVY